MHHLSENVLAWLASLACLIYILRSIKQVLLPAGRFWRSPFVMFTAGALFAIAATAIAIVYCITFLTERCRPISNGAGGTDQPVTAGRGGAPTRQPWLLRRGKGAKGEATAVNLVTTHPSAVRQGSYSGPVWLVPATLWRRGQLASQWPPPTQGPAAIARKFYATLVGSGSPYEAVLLLVPERASGVTSSGVSPQALSDAGFGEDLVLCMERVTVDLLRDVWGTRSPWNKRCPLQLSHPTRALLLGETTVYMFAESGSSKEQWYAALTAAVAPQSLLATTQHLYEDYCRYMASLQIVQPPPMPPAPPTPVTLRPPGRRLRTSQQPQHDQQQHQGQQLHQHMQQEQQQQGDAAAAVAVESVSMADSAKQLKAPAKEREKKSGQQRQQQQHGQQGSQSPHEEGVMSKSPEQREPVVPAPRPRGGRNPLGFILSRFGRGANRRADTSGANAAGSNQGRAVNEINRTPDHNTDGCQGLTEASETADGNADPGAGKPSQPRSSSHQHQSPPSFQQQKPIQTQEPLGVGNIDDTDTVPGALPAFRAVSDIFAASRPLSSSARCGMSTKATDGPPATAAAAAAAAAAAMTEDSSCAATYDPLSDTGPGTGQPTSNDAGSRGSSTSGRGATLGEGRIICFGDQAETKVPELNVVMDTPAGDEPSGERRHVGSAAVPAAWAETVAQSQNETTPTMNTVAPSARDKPQQMGGVGSNVDVIAGPSKEAATAGGWAHSPHHGRTEPSFGSWSCAQGASDTATRGTGCMGGVSFAAAPLSGFVDAGAAPTLVEELTTPTTSATSESHLAAATAAPSTSPTLPLNERDLVGVGDSRSLDAVMVVASALPSVHGHRPGSTATTASLAVESVAIKAGALEVKSVAVTTSNLFDMDRQVASAPPASPQRQLQSAQPMTRGSMSGQELASPVPSNLSLETPFGDLPTTAGSLPYELSPKTASSGDTAVAAAAAATSPRALRMNSSLLAQQSRHGNSMPDLFEMARRIAESQEPPQEGSAAAPVGGAAINAVTQSRRSLDDCRLSDGPGTSEVPVVPGKHPQEGSHLHSRLNTQLHDKHRHTMSLPGLSVTELLMGSVGRSVGSLLEGGTEVSAGRMPRNLSKQDLRRLQREEQERIKQENQRAKAAARAAEDARRAEERAARKRARAAAQQRRQEEVAQAREAKERARSLKQQLGSAKSLQELSAAAAAVVTTAATSSSTPTPCFAPVSSPPRFCNGVGFAPDYIAAPGGAVTPLASEPGASMLDARGAVNDFHRAKASAADLNAGPGRGTQSVEPSLHGPLPAPSAPPCGALVEGLYGLNMVLVRIGFELLRRRGFSGWLHRLIQSKLERVRRPGFLDSLVLRRFDLGFTAPQLRNIRAVAGPNNWGPGSSTWPQLALDVVWVGNATATVSTKIDFDRAAPDRVDQPTASGSGSEVGVPGGARTAAETGATAGDSVIEKAEGLPTARDTDAAAATHSPPPKSAVAVVAAMPPPHVEGTGRGGRSNCAVDGAPVDETEVAEESGPAPRTSCASGSSPSPDQTPNAVDALGSHAAEDVDLQAGALPRVSSASTAAEVTAVGPECLVSPVVMPPLLPPAAAVEPTADFVTSSGEQPTDTPRRVHSVVEAAGRASGKGGGGGGGGGFWMNFVPFFSLLRKAGQALASNIAGSLSGTPVEVHLQASRFEATLLLWLAPPPSDRLWLSFAEPPKMHFTVTPVLGNRTLSGGLVVGRLSAWVRSKVTAGLTRAMVYPGCVDLRMGKLLLSIDSPGDAVRPFVPPGSTTAPPAGMFASTAPPPMCPPHASQLLTPTSQQQQQRNAASVAEMRAVEQQLTTGSLPPPLRAPGRPPRPPLAPSSSAGHSPMEQVPADTVRAAVGSALPQTPPSTLLPSSAAVCNTYAFGSSSTFAAAAANGLGSIASSGSLFENALNHVIRSTSSIWGSSPGTLSPFEATSDAEDDEGEEDEEASDDDGEQRLERGHKEERSRLATDGGDGGGGGPSFVGGKPLRFGGGGVEENGGGEWSPSHVYGDGFAGWEPGARQLDGGGIWGERNPGAVFLGGAVGNGMEGHPPHQHPRGLTASESSISLTGQPLQSLQAPQGQPGRRRSGGPLHWMRGAAGLVARGVGGVGNVGVRGLGAVGSALGQAMLGPVVHAGERAVVQQHLHGTKVPAPVPAALSGAQQPREMGTTKPV